MKYSEEEILNDLRFIYEKYGELSNFSINDSQKKYSQAIEEYKKSYKNNPTLVVANYLIAIVYDTQAQYTKALEFYKKFVSENKEDDEYKAYANSRIHDLKGYEK